MRVPVFRLAAPALPLLCILICGTASAEPHPDPSPAMRQAQRLDALPPVAPRGRAPLDHSGRAEKGKISWYGPGFAGRKMANGRPMNPRADIAASKTLPIGSTAKVTNLENGRSATVIVEDRGPFIDGRVADVSPRVARLLALRKHGVAPALIKPITVPQPDGAIKLGAGAAEASQAEIDQAAKTTQRQAVPPPSAPESPAEPPMTAASH